MRLLLDTHLAIWVARQPSRLSPTARSWLTDENNTPVFSAVNIWEIAIKHSLGRPDFDFDPGRLRAGFLAHGYEEIGVTGPHAVAVAALPPIHSDPFDRLLVAQAQVEGITLLTADEVVASYPGPITRV